VLAFFLVYEIILVVYDFCRTIRAYGCLVFLFMKFGCLCLACRTLRWVQNYWSVRGTSGHTSAEPPKRLCKGC
jgi:hypothetical protein